ncbi:MAG: hypothetical protein ACRDS0_22450 [Pseudonocardiaceae bacterium]
MSAVDSSEMAITAALTGPYREGIQDWVEPGLPTERLHQPV